MLPYLTNSKKNSLAGSIIEKRKPNGGLEREEDSTDYDSAGLEAAAQDIINAIKVGDSKLLASAIKAAFEICESQPHEEAEEPNEINEEG